MDELQERATEFMHLEEMWASQKRKQEEVVIPFVGGERKYGRKLLDGGDTGGADRNQMTFPGYPSSINHKGWTPPLNLKKGWQDFTQQQQQYSINNLVKVLALYQHQVLKALTLGLYKP